MSSLEEAMQYLKMDNGSGNNLYDHLSEVLLKLLVEKPADAHQIFENLSAEIKKTAFTPQAPPEYADDVDTIPTVEEMRNKQLEWTSKASQILKRADEPPEEFCPYPDLLADQMMYEWAGVSFGKGESYRLYLSIKKFCEATSPDYEMIRFWGKIITRNGDYYVLCGKTAEDPEFDPLLEEGKDGANKYTYWVSKHACDNWVMLPRVKPEMIKVARQLSTFFTGNLDAPVYGYPPFPGTEKELLATQITRITNACSVSPVGFFELNEDDEIPQIVKAEDEAINEGFPKPPEEIKELDAWNHHELEINVRGRCRPLPPQEDEEGNEIEDEDPPEEIPPLRSLAEDEEGSWSVRLCPGGAGESAASSLSIAISLVWPGAYGISYGKKWTNVYMGDGMKFRPTVYTRPLPPALQPEWKPNEEEEEEPLVEQADLLEDPTPPEEEED